MKKNHQDIFDKERAQSSSFETHLPALSDLVIDRIQKSRPVSQFLVIS